MNPEIEVDAPARRPFPFGLFTAATERDETRRWRNGVEWLGAGCDSPFVVSGDACEPVEFEKSTGGVRGEAFPLHVYAPFECSPVAWTDQAATAKAYEKLIAGEEQAVERALMTGSAGNTPNLMGDATAITDAAGTPAGTLAMLEDWIVSTYGGLGVLHVSRGAATVLAGADLIRESGTKMLTRIGTPVSVGSGYTNQAPAGTAAAAGEFWAYMSPSLFFYRGDVDTEVGATLDKRQNDLLATAFRTYVIGYDDCGVAAGSFTVN